MEGLPARLSGAGVRHCLRCTSRSSRTNPDAANPTEGRTDQPTMRGSCKVGGDAAQMDPAGAMFGKHQDVQSLQQHGVHMEEVHSEDPGGLGVHELPPGGTRAARCRIDARSAQDLPDGGLRDRHAEFGQFALDPAVSPPRILLRQPDGKAGDAPGPSAGGPARAACSCRTSSRLACGARRAMSLASQGRLRSSACGVSAGPARRTTLGQPTRNAPGRRGGATPRSRAGGPAAQHSAPGPRETPAQRAEQPPDYHVDDLEQHQASQPPSRQSCWR